MAYKGIPAHLGTYPDTMRNLMSTPWGKDYVRPVRMAPHVYSVAGNTWLAIYLLDTTQGLVLVDTGFQESLYMVMANILKLGFDPLQIKKVLLTHGHDDHTGGAAAIKALTGAEVYISQTDYELIDLMRTRLVAPNAPPHHPFEPDVFLKDGDILDMGNIQIECIATPGHTPGAMSFFFDDRDDETGKVVRVGMHGGLGVRLMSDEMLTLFGFPKSLRERFIADMTKMADWDIDVCAPSHSNVIDLAGMIEDLRDDRNYSMFVNRNIWRDLITRCRDDALALNS